MKIVVDTHAWIPLAELTHMQKSALKATLTVTPRSFPGYPGPPPSPIPLYVEKPDFIGIPRSYFMENRKEHHEIVDMTTTGRQDLWDGPFTFAGSLRPTQQEAIDKMSAAFGNGFGGGIIRATTGWGKCLHPDTPVLRFDGTLVPVRTIRAGDLLMGPDSTPRRVEAANAGHGPMYRITPTIGDPWECNDAHILTLVDTKTDTVRDIPLQDYLKLPPSWKHRLKQFSPPTGVDFPSAEALPLDPYFVGLWYGDGTKALNGVAVSKPDPEVLQTCHDIAAKFGLHVRTEAIDGKCPTHHLSGVAGKPNALLNMLRVIYGDGTALPHRYLTASRADRQSFLAGYLDSDGYHNNGCYEIVQKNKGFADGLAFTARSLGIRATVRLKEVNGAPYWRVKFAGDFYGLPLRIPRKKPRKRLQLKVATRTGFSVERLPDGDFFGIVLDGDHRYLLGDFTVTHNTVFACAAMARMNCPTLVIVHKEFLLNQWRDRIAQFLPGAKIGIVQQDRSEFKGYSVAIAMVHSLVGDRDYGEDFWDWPGLVITDECHRTAAESWSRAHTRFRARWRLGVSATPRRKDGAEEVFLKQIGPVIFTSAEQRMKPKVRRVWTDFKLIQTPTLNPEVISKNVLLKFMCSNAARNKMIAEQIVLAVVAGRKPIVLSERLNHLDTLEALFKQLWKTGQSTPVPTTGFYVGGMKEEELETAAEAQVIFATRQFAEEGLDIPMLDSIFLTTPFSDVEQAVGRILRPIEGKKDPIVVDIIDPKVSLCVKSAGYRDRLYKTKGWE